MKCLLLSIMASASFTCFGAALEIVQSDDDEDRDAIPHTILTMPSIDPQNPLSRIIKVTTNAHSYIRYDVAVKNCETSFLDNVNHRLIACLLADTELQGEKPAQQLLELLQPLELSYFNMKSDQYAQIKQTVSNSPPFSQYKRIVVFVIERVFGTGSHNTFLYMRILNETTQHCGGLRSALYCKLNSSKKASIVYEEAGMSEEVWRDLGGIAPDALGFEIDHAEICRQLPGPGCVML